MEKRTLGYLLTIASTILCALPGLALICLGTLTTASIWLPSEGGSLARGEAAMLILVALGMVCVGAIGLVIPLAAGFWTRKSSAPPATAAAEIGPLPDDF